MHKTVFEYKPPNDKKNIFKFSSGGKQLTPDQLANNLKTVIHLRSLQDKAEEAEVAAGLYYRMLRQGNPKCINYNCRITGNPGTGKTTGAMGTYW